MKAHGEQLRADFRREYGLSLTEVLRGNTEVGLQEAAGLACNLPPGSMVWREYGGYAAWSDEVATATMIVHRLDILAWQKANEGRTNKLKQPEPIEPPRPRAEIEAENARMERKALRFLEQQRKRAASS